MLSRFDPTLVPIANVAGEAALQHPAVEDDWLRSCFARARNWTPEFPEDLSTTDDKPRIRAAVLIPIVMHPDGNAGILLTRRTAQLADHPGQISFPGGRMDSIDATPIDTALREAYEEIGLSPKHVEVIGQLPEYPTISGYTVTPIAALVHPRFELSPAPDEVAEIFEVPFDHLMNGAHHQRRSLALPQGQRTFYSIVYENHFIWGATAGMLRNLFLFLRADGSR